MNNARNPLGKTKMRFSKKKKKKKGAKLRHRMQRSFIQTLI